MDEDQAQPPHPAVMMWMNDAEDAFLQCQSSLAVMPCSLNRALVKHAAWGGREGGREGARQQPPDDKWRAIKLSLSPLIRSRSPPMPI